jgi:beta-glucosidase
MHEVYLAPFEHAVKTAGVWSVMSAYNAVDYSGENSPMSEHDALVNGLLKQDWGFDGVVISDWMATRRTVEAALGGLDLVMPGPGGPWEQHLLEAVRDGRVPEAVIDDKVARILLLAERTRDRGLPVSDEGDDRFLRDLAARSVVVIKRGETFPVTQTPASVALIGPNAVSAYVLGGGSSTVNPVHVVSPAEGFQAALPDAELTLVRGGDARRHAPVLDAAALGSGVTVTYLDAHGAELDTEHLAAWTGWLRELPDAVETVVLDAQLDLTEPGEHWIELGTVGRYRLELDGTVVAGGNRAVGAEVILDSSINSPDGDGGLVAITEPRLVPLRATLGVIRAGGYGNIVRAELRHHRPGPTAEDEIRIAVEEAARADLVVLIVGTNDEVESEGWDRTSLRLPGRQDELVERVLAVAPDAVIIVNAGAPLVLPWLERARTVLWAWFPGQECGHALADVVLGRTEPAGRLPWTLPARETDVPVPDAKPDAGRVEYYEGVHVGYRSWEKNNAVPAAAFGHGLGWTEWRYDSVVDAGERELDVTITNTGERAGTEVVQVYLEAPGGAFERPVRWLGGFATATVAAGESATVRVAMTRRSFEVWDAATSGWALPPGDYGAAVGRSVRDIRLRSTLPISVETTAEHEVSPTEEVTAP